ncbi:MAG: C39 family peptidase [Patescibacteria group bacterium]|nr:C39 family peptidase [Patescibacteria group bacterium]
MRNALKITFVILILAILLALDLFLVTFFKQKEQGIANEYQELLNIATENENNKVVQNVNTEEKVKEPEFVIPEACDLEVPFTCQAPYQNWAEPWQEACEEASLMMIDHYLKGEYFNQEMPKNVANQEILDMVDWQMQNWGGHYDLKAENIAKLAKEYYGYKNVEVKYDIMIDDIKEEVAKGNPVLVPTAGQLLANPHFTAPGPVYHNLVVVGFDENGFITNDPGVWQGFKFRYTFDNLFDSIHDFIDGTSKSNPYPILNGRKAMVVIKK